MVFSLPYTRCGFLPLGTKMSEQKQKPTKPEVQPEASDNVQDLPEKATKSDEAQEVKGGGDVRSYVSGNF